VELAAFREAHLPAVIELCRQEDWPTYPSNPESALRALAAPGTVTLVAVIDDDVVGFAHALTDGVTAYLAQLLVGQPYRRQGVGRSLVDAMLARCARVRMDLLSDTAEHFYGQWRHKRYTGFRLYPPDADPRN
jgi:GNAT superfamily N-acetyltransferase